MQHADVQVFSRARTFIVAKESCIYIYAPQCNQVMLADVNAEASISVVVQHVKETFNQRDTCKLAKSHFSSEKERTLY